MPSCIWGDSKNRSRLNNRISRVNTSWLPYKKSGSISLSPKPPKNKISPHCKNAISKWLQTSSELARRREFTLKMKILKYVFGCFPQDLPARGGVQEDTDYFKTSELKDRELPMYIQIRLYNIMAKKLGRTSLSVSMVRFKRVFVERWEQFARKGLFWKIPKQSKPQGAHYSDVSKLREPVRNMQKQI